MYQDKEFQDNVLRINTLLKVKEVADILQISRAMAYTLMQRGDIPTVWIRKARRVRPEDLIKYIERNTYSMNQYFE
jgi:excisionase family DNA binding protein